MCKHHTKSHDWYVDCYIVNSNKVRKAAGLYIEQMGILHQKQLSRAWISNYNSGNTVGVMIYPMPRYLLQSQMSWYMCKLFISRCFYGPTTRNNNISQTLHNKENQLKHNGVIHWFIQVDIKDTDCRCDMISETDTHLIATPFERHFSQHSMAIVTNLFSKQKLVSRYTSCH